MSTPQPVLLARGRDADVYALDDATVLRRVREPGAARVEHEARVMAHLAAHGYPVPRVYEARETELVMQRLTGPTLLEDLARRPAALRANARILARLHDDLAAVPAPAWLAPPGGDGDENDDKDGFGTGAGHGDGGAGPAPAGHRPDHRPGRRSVLHLDLHPGNVILTPHGPVVIDWTNAAVGDPAFDLAKTIVTMATAQLPPHQRLLCRLYLTALRRAARTDPRPRLADAARAKLLDPNLAPAETARLHAVIARETGRRGRARAAA